jgi:hypothetical protein
VIEEELKAHGDYAFTWHQHSDGALTHKQNIYSWLDEASGDVLMLRSDITHTYEEEQKPAPPPKRSAQERRRGQ